MEFFSNAQGQLAPQSLVESCRILNSSEKHVLCFKFVLHTCKTEEDLTKNEGARVLIRLYDIFSDAQGQLTPKSAAEFCQNSNSSKLL